MIEKDFVTEGLRRTRIDEYLEKELERAGYGGMDVQITPLGTMVVVYAERPGMVIGRGGKNVRAITNTLKNEFGLDNPQIEVKEVEVYYSGVTECMCCGKGYEPDHRGNVDAFIECDKVVCANCEGKVQCDDCGS